MIRHSTHAGATALLAAALALGAAPAARAEISGITGPTFNLVADWDYLSTAEGNSVLFWGYGLGVARAQYPGPTMIVQQGDLVTVNLTNHLDMPVSILFPGQTGVSAAGGDPGLLTQEAAPGGGTVTYTFVAGDAGTFIYHSATRPDLQVEMGLFGALIVRSAHAGWAYDHADSAYDKEFLYVLSEMDPTVHDHVEFGRYDLVDTTRFRPTYWFINGRTAPDTMLPANTPWLPAQPYTANTRFNPADRVLMRVIGAGRHMHPFHHHGNHAQVIARDGRLLSSAPGAGADLSHPVFTIKTAPGKTIDALFTWTGKGLGWDIYGHAPGDPLEPEEYAPDHGKPFPVQLPELQNLTFGGFYSGSPFLGTAGALLPGEGGLNPKSGFAYMWHSHTEMEMVNFDVFPGGMMTIAIIEPFGAQ